MGSGLHLVDQVAGTATANVVDGCLLGAETFLLLEFLVEAEDGAFRLLHVAGTATTGGVEGVSRWGRKLSARGWASGSGARGDVCSLDAHSVTGTATARVHVGGGGGVRLADVEVDHFDCLVARLIRGSGCWCWF